MIQSPNTKRILLAASAMAAIMMTACDNNVEPSQEAGNTAPAVDNKGAQGGPSGMLKEPLVPTAEQIRLIEDAAKNQKIPETPKAQADAPALAKTAGADYNINFNDYGALSLPSDHDYLTFAPFYIPQVRYGVWAYVMPMTDGHFHMAYENPNVCFSDDYGNFVPSGKYGIKSGKSCIVQGDAATQPRFLGTHEATQQIQTYVWDGSTKYVFDLKSIYLEPNGGNAAADHIQIWIHKIDVGWRYWADLGSAPGGYTWYFPQTGIGGAQGIDEVRVLSPTTSYPVFYDNMVINVH